MRLLLDAHISGPRIAVALRDSGHDVIAADEDRSLDGASDEELLSLAFEQGRIMVTFDVKDFPDILRRWAEAGRPHCGCVIVVGIDHGEFGAALKALEETFKDLPDQEAWKDRASFVSRARDDADAEPADGRL